MTCETCSELLADFLLDELPESEAVLVHEHLNLCPACMTKYKQLKGTGKALEAVTAMKAIDGSKEFGDNVRTKAAVESAIIVAKLPPDRRLRLEARRAARQSRAMPAVRPPSIWNASLMLVVLAGVVVLSAITISSLARHSSGQRTQLGKLSVALGRVEQFFQKKNEPHSAVKQGSLVLRGDAYSTGENSKARFEIDQDGAVFLGPDSALTFRMPPSGSEDMVLVLEKGEVGIEREARDAATNMDVRLGDGTVKLSRGAHVYIKHGEPVSELFVLAGKVDVQTQGGALKTSVETGQRIAFSKSSKDLRPESLSDARVPAWRVELFGDRDLASLVNADARILGRRDEGVEVEIWYSRRPKRPGEFEDWSTEPAGVSLNDSLTLPPRIRLRHSVHLAAPMSLELSLSPESNRETAFAFGVLDSVEGSVVVDAARELVLQVLEQTRTVRREQIPTRAKAGTAETLKLDIVREKTGLAAVLTAGATRTKPLALPKPNAAGEIWIQPLGEGIVLDGVKLSGILPAAWLRDRLSRSTSLP